MAIKEYIKNDDKLVFGFYCDKGGYKRVNIFERKFGKKMNRALAMVLAVVCAFSFIYVDGLSMKAVAAPADDTGVISTVDDPETLTRPLDTFGNSTLNAGKILVGKSVTDGINDRSGAAEVLDLSSELFQMPNGTNKVFSPKEDNFLVTISQSSQMYGVSSEIPIPVDVVFVLDVSNSMDNNKTNNVTRTSSMVTAANNAIKTILQMNDQNRVSVVAFSSVEQSGSNVAATVLSSLNHYDDTSSNKAASKHITHSNDRLYGRKANGESGTYRDVDGGTNIQAGILLGAEQLMNATGTQVTIGEGSSARTITRIPIMVILSDGAPTFSVDHNEWWNVDHINKEQGPGSSSTLYSGNGFKAALAAAYYKEKISEKYYGEGNKNSSLVYTIGVGVGGTGANDANRDANRFAQVTLNPSERLSSNFSYAETFRSYWSNYNRLNGGYNDYFTVSVGNNSNYRFNYKNYTYYGNTYRDNVLAPSPATLTYNDDYFAANDGEIEKSFEELIIEIQKRAITVPTITDTLWGENYSGYVRFTDPIGEYMEVKEIKGISNNGYLHQGKYLAKLAEGYDPDWDSEDYDWNSDWNNSNEGITQENQAFFNASLEQSLMDRINSTAGGTVSYINQETAKQILDVVTRTEVEGDLVVQINDQLTRTFDYDTYGGQLYYNNDEDYNSNIWWFGKQEVPEGEEDAIVKFIGVAPKNADSIAWLSDPANKDLIKDAQAAGANCVVRSYYTDGSANGVAPSSASDMMHFQLFVIRELEGPVYQQSVHIKLPASLLALQRVLINDTDPSNMKVHYEDLIPARVIYEVGLREDITADNVWNKVDGSYLSEYGNRNTDGSFRFYTNDFTRFDSAEDVERLHDHTHALTYASFDAADNNSFYCYEEDTLIVDALGNAVQVNPNGGNYYYRREYYTWTPSVSEKETQAFLNRKLIGIKVSAADITSGAVFKASDGKWYVKAGSYTAHNLTDGDDIFKTLNETATAQRVVHPERTSTANNSHYKVWLGNNGVLTFMPNKPKTVHAVNTEDDSISVGAINIDGETVVVGSVLEYQIEATNSFDQPSKIVIEDKIPRGTSLVSVYEGGIYNSDNDTITWTLENVEPGETVYVSFWVKVEESAIVEIALTNQAHIEIGNNIYDTNITTNPVTGKQAVKPDGSALPDEGVTVGDIIDYRIAWVNNTDQEAIITITDVIPAGTTLIDDSITHNGIYDPNTNTITWVLGTEEQKINPGTNGVVSFDVRVNADVLQGTDGSFAVENSAEYLFNNDPGTKIDTNRTVTKVKTGDVQVTKNLTVAEGQTSPDNSFVLTLTEGTGKLDGTFKTQSSINTAVEGEITFTDGMAEVTIAEGETITIVGLPNGIMIQVQETVGKGYSVSYSPSSGMAVIDAETIASVTVNNDYKAAATSLIINGTKNFTNNDSYDQTRQFTFELQSTDETGQLITAIDLADTISVTAGAGKTASENFTFAELHYDRPGEYYYLLSEVNSGLKGVTYDADTYWLKVAVNDQGGQLTAKLYLANNNQTGNQWSEITKSASGVYSDLAFGNSFAPLRTSVKFLGKKTLENNTLSDLQFSFVIKEACLGQDNKLTGFVNTYGQNAADGSINFTEIAYDKAGTYIYVIEEVPGQASAITYDTTKYYYKVVVTDNNGQLEKKIYKADRVNLTIGEEIPEVTWTNVTESSDDPTISTNVIVFKNVYHPGYTYVDLKAYKKLVGRDMSEAEFHFVVKDASGKVITQGSNASGANGALTEFTFQPIPYDLTELAGGEDGDQKETFVYTISELPGSDSNITYDTAKTYTAEVTVEYDPATGSWKTPVIVYKNSEGNILGNDDNSSKVEFVNNFTPDPVILNLSGIGNKITTGENQPTDLTFGYTIVKVDCDDVDVVDGSIIATGTSQASGNITFTDITIRKPGIHTMKLYENNGGEKVHGVTYGKEMYQITVEVTQNASTGALSIGEITYHELKHTEQNRDEVSGGNINSGDVIFRNTYEANGSLLVTAKKEVAGRNLTGGEYNFRLTEVVSETDHTPKGNNVHVGTNKSDGDVIFDALLFTNDDANSNLYYVMEEIPGVNTNIIYDSTKYLVTVSVEINAADNSKLDAKVISVKKIKDNGLENVTGNIAVFKNEGKIYEGTNAKFNIIKELSGRTMTAGEFSFKVTHVETRIWNGSEYVTDQNAVVKGLVATEAAQANNTSFAVTIPISNEGFSAANPVEQRQFIYEVKEINDGLKSVTYDENVYTVTVSGVGDADLDGKLDPITDDQIQISGGVAENIHSATNTITFKNSYRAASVDVNLHAYKTLKDKVTGELVRIPADVFDFEAYLIQKDTTILTTPVLQETGSNEAAVTGSGANIPFTTFTFDSAGTYLYKIVESVSGHSYITNSTEDWYVEIVVTDDTANGCLVASVKIAESADGIYTAYDPERKGSNSQIQFENIYDAEDAVVVLEVSKTLTGRVMDAGEFTFEAYKAEVVNEKLVESANSPRAAVGSNGAPDENNKANVSLSQIGFDAEGTYYFIIKEALHEDVHVKNTTEKSIFAEVIIVNEGGGKLKVQSVTYMDEEKNVLQGGATFTNAYTPTPLTDARVYAQKNLTGGKKLTEDAFQFTLTQISNGAPNLNTSDDNLMYQVVSGNDANGLVEFVLPVIREKGNYEFTLTEVSGGDISTPMKYDGSEYKVTVAVTDDGIGTLSADVTYQVKGENNSYSAITTTVPEFNNVYVPEEIPVKLHTLLNADGAKRLIGRDMNDRDIFHFEVRNVLGHQVATGTNNADGEITFAYIDRYGNPSEGIMINQIGVYRYTVTEIAGDQPGITYDPAVWTVQVIVVQDPVTGELMVKEGDGLIILSVSNSSADPAGKIVFNNQYDAVDAEVVLKGNKVLIGNRNTASIKENEFQFRLVELDASGNPVTIAAYGKTLDGGDIVFEKLTFTEPTEKNYLLIEVTGAEPGIKYNVNRNQYEVTIKVEDDTENAKLIPTVTINGAAYADDIIEFTNHYYGLQTSAEIAVSKTLEGKSLSETEAFEFTLEKVSGPELSMIENVKNDVNGNVTFKLDFSTIGTYEFKLTEVKGTNSEVTYDESVITVIAAVTDPGNGYLVADITYKDADGNVLDEPGFVNKWTPAPEPEPDPEPEPEPPVDTPVQVPSQETDDDSVYLPFIVMMMIGAVGLIGVALREIFKGKHKKSSLKN